MAEVNRREIYRYLGIKGQQEPDPQTKDLVEDCLGELERSVNCRSFYRRYPLTLLPDSELDFTCFKVKSRALSRNLKDCQEVILFAATLGAGVDLLLRRYSRLSMSRAVVLQACAAARIESYCNEINDKLKAEAAEEGLHLRPRFSPDDHYQDLKRIIGASIATAHRVNVIMPFLYEGRQHKRSGRESLDCAMMLEELIQMGVSNIITFDAHDPRVQNSIPLSGFDNFMPTYQFIKALLNHDKTLKIDKDNLMVISPDEGAMSRAVYLANNLGVDMGMFYKRRDYSRVVNGRNPIVAHEFLGSSVEGKTVLIIDDMISSGESMLDTCRALKERKAKRVVVCATFGLFTNGLEKFDEFFAKGYLDCVVTTNLNYHTPELLKRDWYVEADMSKFIAAIINSLNHNVSLENALTPTAKIQKLIKRYNEGQM